MSISLTSIFSLSYFIIIVTSSSVGTVQLSAQVSECLSLDLLFLHFISSSLVRHRAGDVGQDYGSGFESGFAGFEFGGWYSSVFEYEDWDSGLYGQQLLVILPSARDTTFVSFVGELF